MNPCTASTLKGQNSTFNVKEAILLLAGSSALCEPFTKVSGGPLDLWPHWVVILQRGNDKGQGVERLT